MNYQKYSLHGGHWEAQFRAVRVLSRIEEYAPDPGHFMCHRLSTRL